MEFVKGGSKGRDTFVVAVREGNIFKGNILNPKKLVVES